MNLLRKNPTWRDLAPAAAIALLAIFGVWWIGGPIFSAGTLRSLRGKTQDEVRQILGDPWEIEEYRWLYSRRWNPGYVNLYFDEDGLVRGVSDEQAAPEIFGSGGWSEPFKPAAEAPDATSDSN
jgi:hypothetical protein